MLCRSVNIHLLNLLDGSPHEVPLRKVLQLDLEHHDGALANPEVSSSRIALAVTFLGTGNGEGHKELVVWDWRVGEVVSVLLFCWMSILTSTQVFRRSDNDTGVGSTVSGISTMEFLGGTWLLAVSHRPEPELLIIDTLPPDHDSMRSWRILELPSLTQGGAYCISTQYEDSLAEYPEFSVDPAQKHFVVFSPGELALVVPVKLLRWCMDRGHADRRISWNDWGKDVTTIHIPGIASVRIVDLKLLALRGSLFYPEPWSVEVYDLSKSANKGIRVQGVSEEQEGRYGTVPPTPKPFGTCQGEGEILLRTFAMGNKVVCIYVSPPVRLRPVVLDSTSYYAEFVFTL